MTWSSSSSTYWQVDVSDEEVQPGRARQDGGQGADDEAVVAEGAVRQFSKHSKDHRTDLPQVVIAMAVTAEGVPIRCWTFPGRTSDQKIIRRIETDLGYWMLGRLLWVADSGFNSAANRVALQAGGDGFISCEKLRSTPADAKAALSRPGRYKQAPHATGYATAPAALAPESSSAW